MKFLSFKHDGQDSFGGINESGDQPAIVNLSKRSSDLSDLRDVIRNDRLNELTELVQSSDADLSLDDVELVPTIPNPEKIICIGVNYANRNAEYKDGSDLPKYPREINLPDGLLN